VFVVNGVSLVKALKASSTGIDLAVNTSISLFPNPANHEFSIIGNVTIDQVEINSLDGHLVKSVAFNGQSTDQEILITISELNPGVYFIKIKTAQELLVKKLVVQ